jgi:phosphoglucomutase
MHTPPIPGPDFDEEACQEDGDQVYVHTIDADSPGGCSSSWVAYWDGRYWAMGDSIDPSGPYTNVEDAIRLSGISELTGGVTHQIACDSLKTEAILTLIGSAQPRGADIGGISVEVNGGKFVFQPGGGFKKG